MAELNGVSGVWRTVGGRRIFIKDGQDLASAMKDSGKFSNKKNTKPSKKEIMEKYRSIKKTGTYEELDELWKQIRECDEINKTDKLNMYNVLENTSLRLHKKEIEYKEKSLDENKTETQTKESNKNEESKTIIDEKEKQNISNDIEEFLEYEDGKIDTDNYSKTEALRNEIWEKCSKRLNRELTDEEYEFIEGQLDAFYKDGFFVAKNSYSLKEYSIKVNNLLDEVDQELTLLDYDVKVSRSIYQGLVASRYYTKDGVTVRIGDHTNSNNASASHTRDELYNSSIQDLVKYVQKEYDELIKMKK